MAKIKSTASTSSKPAKKTKSPQKITAAPKVFEVISEVRSSIKQELFEGVVKLFPM
ncbi:hypothetical protein Dimus_002984, partial [Dionaea muscipula]